MSAYAVIDPRCVRADPASFGSERRFAEVPRIKNDCKIFSFFDTK